MEVRYLPAAQRRRYKYERLDGTSLPSEKNRPRTRNLIVPVVVMALSLAVIAGYFFSTYTISSPVP